VILQLDSHHIQAIAAHAERTYPEECCGLLLGRSSTGASESKTVVEARATENVWTQNLGDAIELPTDWDVTQHKHFWIDPREMLQIQRAARDRYLDIIGVYHSHPDHPATPSEMDRMCAWAHYSYIIVSVQHGKVIDLRSWSLTEDHRFQSEDILIAEAA
jgi:proteasome lid subunit RPN8/RPN11